MLLPIDIIKDLRNYGNRYAKIYVLIYQKTPCHHPGCPELVEAGDIDIQNVTVKRCKVVVEKLKEA